MHPRKATTVLLATALLALVVMLLMLRDGVSNRGNVSRPLFASPLSTDKRQQQLQQQQQQIVPTTRAWVRPPQQTQRIQEAHPPSIAGVTEQLQQRWPQRRLDAPATDTVDGLRVYDLTRGGLSTDVDPLVKSADLMEQAECLALLANPELAWPADAGPWRQLTVLVLGIGLSNIRERAEKAGGPMGEVVFFATYVTALLCSGHRIVLVEDTQAVEGRNLDWIDFYVTERIWIGTPTVLANLGITERFPCRARLMDYFGASAQSVPAPYSSRQIITPYPYKTGNDFIGMIIKNRPMTDEERQAPKQPIGLIWGKEPSYFKKTGVMDMLMALNETRLYATINQNKLKDSGLVLPSHIKNVGSLKRDEFLKLLRSCRFLIGLGDPILGPTALEAIANSLVFLNPLRRFGGHIPNTQNWDDNIRTQHHYLETVGEPYVRTIDIDKVNEVHQIVQEVLTGPVPPPHPLPDFTIVAVAGRVLANLLDGGVCTVSTGPTLAMQAVIG